MSQLIIDTYKPSEEEVNFANEYRAMYGDQALDMLYRFKIIKDFLKNKNKPHLFIQILKNFLFTISSQDPTKFHFEIARQSLAKIDEKELENTQSIDLLARSLVEACNKLYKKLKIPSDLEKLINDCREADPNKKEIVSYYLDFVECPEANEEFEKQFFEENGLSLWDNTYFKQLRSSGAKGREYVKEFSEKIKNKENGWDQYFWFVNPEIDESFFHSPALIILASTLWEDEVKGRVRFANKQVPALTTSVNEPINKILSPKNKVIEKENQLQLFHKESLVGTIQIPTINQKFIAVVFNGVKKLNTVTGHRFTRYLVGTAFDKVVNGHDDPRVLKLDRGASDICEQLGLNGKKHVTNIKEIAHAMAYFEFRESQLSGNLIQLSKYKSPITGREDEGYLITIGTPLIPYQTFDAIRKGECGLLIPLLKDPPLVGSSRSHAGQYLLQMNIMSEFSKQSVELYNEGVIEIIDSQWEEFAQSCGLTADVLHKIKDRWTQDGDDGAKFLIKVEDDFYTLGPEYQKVLDFLKRQGEIRTIQSLRGTASIIKQKKAKQGKKLRKRK